MLLIFAKKCFLKYSFKFRTIFSIYKTRCNLIYYFYTWIVWSILICTHIWRYNVLTLIAASITQSNLQNLVQSTSLFLQLHCLVHFELYLNLTAKCSGTDSSIFSGLSVALLSITQPKSNGSGWLLVLLYMLVFPWLIKKQWYKWPSVVET